MKRAPATRELYRLASLYGIQTAYYDVSRRRKQASAESLMATLRLLNAPVAGPGDVPSSLREAEQAHWRQPIEPVLVVWDGQLPEITVRLPSLLADATLTVHVDSENGQSMEWPFRGTELPTVESAEVEGTGYVGKKARFPQSLPSGYHHLRLALRGREYGCLIIVAPRSAYTPAHGQQRAWGLFLPLYALQTGSDWGCGDFSDLGTLTEWLMSFGGSAMATLPLLPVFVDGSASVSPYAPVSRLLWNELYVDVSAAPDFEKCATASRTVDSAEFRRQIEADRRMPLVDYPGQMAVKRKVLEELSRCISAGSRRAIQDFVGANPVVGDYARFRATCEQQGKSWKAWPPSLRDGGPAQSDYGKDARDYYVYSQWLAHQQVEALQRAICQNGSGICLDLPLGVHPDGYDTWRHKDLFVHDADVGAPPDSAFTWGQNWGFPPMHPDVLRRQGYSYYIQSLRHHLRHAGILRIDHVMAFHRLFWIPRGLDGRHGVYVRYRPEEFYAILALESQRSRTIVVGENLGTVPPEVGPCMSRHGLYRMYVAQYELSAKPEKALRQPGRDEVASLNTHDMPPFAAFWKGLDIEERRALGVLGEANAAEEAGARSALKRSVRTFLRRRGFLPGKGNVGLHEALRAFIRFLSSSRAAVVLINVEDLWLETESQNVPGTDGLRSNWQRKARFQFDEFSRMPEVLDVLIQASQIRERGVLCDDQEGRQSEEGC
jgi:4-alpha-glucanotransferase